MKPTMQRLGVLIVTMTTVSLSVAAVGLWSIHRINITEQRERCQRAAQNIATLIEAIAQEGKSEQEILKTVSKVEDNSFESLSGKEILIAKYQDKKIVCLFNYNLKQVSCPNQISVDIRIALPIQKALNKETGNLIGLDYGGEKVVGGYSFVKGLNWGVAVKTKLKTFDEPFDAEIKRLLVAALSLNSLGALLCVRISDSSPKIKEEILEKYFFSGMLDTTDTLIMVLDPEGRILLFNQACQTLTGYTFEEVQGKRFQDILLYTEKARKVNQVLELNQQINYWRTKQGKVIMTDWRNTSIVGKNGRVKYIVGNGINITELFPFQDALKQSEAAFRAMFEKSVMGIAFFETTGKVIKTNLQLQKILLYSGQELEVLSWFDLTYSEDKHIEDALYQEILTGQRDHYQINKRYIRKSGQIFLCRSLVWAIYGENSELNFLVAMVENITNNTHIPLNSQGVIQALGEIFYECHLVQNWIKWEGEGTNILGYSVQELGQNAQDWLNLIHIDDLMRVKIEVETALREKRLFDIEYRLRHSEGHYLWVLDRGVVLYQRQSGQPERIVGVILDITEQKQAQAAKKKLEEEYRTIIETTIEGIWVIDELGFTTFTNEMTCQLLGYSPEEMQGKLFLDFTDNEGKELSHYYLERRKQGIKESHDFKFIHKNGREVWVIISTNPILSQEGKYIGAIGLMTDITERKIAEASLTQANQQLSDLVRQLEQKNQEILQLNKAQESLQLCTGILQIYEILPKLIQKQFSNCSGGLFMLNTQSNQRQIVAKWGTEKEEVISSLCIPLTAGGKEKGLLFLYSLEKDYWNFSNQQLAKSLTENISLSLTNLLLRETLQEHSVTDELTGLYNRRYWSEALKQQISFAKREGMSVAVIMIDLDHFKKINDTFSHYAGDLVLQKVAELLINKFRESDIPCRYGGEEFLVILPRANCEAAFKRAEEVRLAIKSLVIDYSGQQVAPLSASFGVSSYPHQADSATTILQTADLALYQAKHQGRDRVCCAC